MLFDHVPEGQVRQGSREALQEHGGGLAGPFCSGCDYCWLVHEFTEFRVLQTAAHAIFQNLLAASGVGVVIKMERWIDEIHLLHEPFRERSVCV